MNAHKLCVVYESPKLVLYILYNMIMNHLQKSAGNHELCDFAKSYLLRICSSWADKSPPSSVFGLEALNSDVQKSLQDLVLVECLST